MAAFVGAALDDHRAGQLVLLRDSSDTARLVDYSNLPYLFKSNDERCL